MFCRRSSMIVLALILLAGCRSLKDESQASAAFETAPLAGMVYAVDGRPVRGARIRIDENTEALSDINGRFVTEPIPPGIHSFRISREGFEPQEQTVEFTDRLQVLYISLVSFDHLLAEAEARLDNGDVTAAAGLLERAEKIEPGDPALLMLQLVAAERGKDAAGADMLRDRLEEAGIPVPPDSPPPTG